MTETEATLIICSEDPLSVAAGIGALTAVAGYPLVPQDPVEIRDYYVDTPDGRLHSADFSLRVREINGSPWLTLKGPPRSISHGLVERLELEVPWSRDSLVQICDELAHHSVCFPAIPNGNETSPPAGALALMDLHKIQYRENHRQIRDVMATGANTGAPLAELSMDSVVYHFQGRSIHHYEIEIEAKCEAGIEAIPAVMQGLLDAYPSELQVWEHGKLRTGRAVEALLAQGCAARLIDEQDRLLPSAYPRIQQFLEQVGD